MLNSSTLSPLYQSVAAGRGTEPDEFSDKLLLPDTGVLQSSDCFGAYGDVFSTLNHR